MRFDWLRLRWNNSRAASKSSRVFAQLHNSSLASVFKKQDTTYLANGGQVEQCDRQHLLADLQTLRFRAAAARVLLRLLDDRKSLLRPELSLVHLLGRGRPAHEEFGKVAHELRACVMGVITGCDQYNEGGKVRTSTDLGG